MKSFSCHVQQIQNKFKVQIQPLLTGATYALYILIKPEGEKRFKRVFRFSYSQSNIFHYISEMMKGEILFQFFVKKDGEVLCNDSVKVKINYRKIIGVNKLSFDQSFDLDVVSDYIVPVKFSKINDLKRCVVLFNGALSARIRNKYPIYSRGSWTNKFGYNTLNIFDASLNLSQDYLLPWYQGTIDKPLFPDIVDIIEKMKLELKIENRDLIFYGSSGGGWTALKFAEYFPGVTSVAINPQISILRYNIESAISKLLSFSFSDLSTENIELLGNDRLSVSSKCFRKDVEGAEKSRFILVQNKQDKHHYQEHFLSFWKQFSNQVKTGWDREMHNFCILYDHPSGHAGEPDEVFNEIMNTLKFFK